MKLRFNRDGTTELFVHNIFTKIFTTTLYLYSFSIKIECSSNLNLSSFPFKTFITIKR